MPVGELWTDRELQAALDIYLYALRLDQSGVRLREDDLVGMLQAGMLRRRNTASIRYRLRNISAVLQKLGHDTIGGFPPATKVGSGVEARLRAMLPSAVFGLQIAASPGLLPERSKATVAAEALQNLVDALQNVDATMLGLGHNNPPEEIEPNTLRGDLRRAIAAVEALRGEVLSDAPNVNVVRTNTLQLAQSGAGWAAWFAARGTKAADVAFATVVPLVLLGLAALCLRAVLAVTQLFPGAF